MGAVMSWSGISGPSLDPPSRFPSSRGRSAPAPNKLVTSSPGLGPGPRWFAGSPNRSISEGGERGRSSLRLTDWDLRAHDSGKDPTKTLGPFLPRRTLS